MSTQDIKDLLLLISQSNISEVKIVRDGTTLEVRTALYHAPVAVAPAVAAPVALPVPAPAVVVPAPAPAPAPTPVVAPAPAPAPASGGKIVEIKSPMVGTFYRAPGPDKPAFVSVGDVIQKGSVVCIIEAMKLFNEIEAEYGGKVVKILVDDATPVEYEQPLMLVELA